jgi:hypothetical protein
MPRRTPGAAFSAKPGRAIRDIVYINQIINESSHGGKPASCPASAPMRQKPGDKIRSFKTLGDRAISCF